MTLISCAETIRRLDDYLDRELSAVGLTEVEAHLDVCARCAAEFGYERSLLEDIRNKLRRIQAPAGLLARISVRLRSA